jgi:GNAT superfamily N-acetyltransferase
MIRLATPSDIDDLAALHVQSWAETYPGLLPADEIARRTHASRRAQWENQIAVGTSRIVIAPGKGFAQVGAQRDEDLGMQGYPEELYAIHVLQAAQGAGLGRQLLLAALGPNALPFSALVMEDNAAACGFCGATGGRVVARRPARVGQTRIIELAYGWDTPPQA